MRLLGPLVCPRILPQGSLPASVMETQDFFRKAYVPSIQREVPSPGYILNLPLLSQLGLMLPRWILYEGISVACSATIDQMNLRDLRDHITQDPPMLLLVSGRSNNNQQHVTFGLFYPKGFLPDGYDEELEPRMLQFEPVQRYFGTHNSKDYSIQFDLEGENPTMTGQVTWQTKVLLKEESNTAPTDRFIVKDDVMNLTVSSKGLGHFMVRAHRFPGVDEYFDVDAVELVKCDNQRIFVADYEYDECYYYLDDD